MKPIVYLDMDGVLSDFVSGIHHAMGVPYNIYQWPYPREWDFWGNGACPFTLKQANQKCTARFWASLPWMEDGQAILNAVLRIVGNVKNLAVLTKPMKNPESYTGKARWICIHAPMLSHRLIPTHIDKSEFARPGAILIDDREESVDQFRVAGGDAVLVARPWNSLWKFFNEGHAVDRINDDMKRLWTFD
jgi:5'(3')-deoxyribonucleotidase